MSAGVNSARTVMQAAMRWWQAWLILDSKSALWAAKLADINGLALSFPSR
jgi:hypothetical protein